MGKEKIDIIEIELLNNKLGMKCIRLLQTNDNKWNWTSDRQMFEALDKLGTDEAIDTKNKLIETSKEICDYYGPKKVSREAGINNIYDMACEVSWEEIDLKTTIENIREYIETNFNDIINK
jgi:hypothetical protein